jgi:hypothetical protein
MEAGSSVWEEAELPSYNTFSDYTQMLIQVQCTLYPIPYALY